MNEPQKTIPIASPAVSPFARLLEPSDHAEELHAAATLIDCQSYATLEALNITYQNPKNPRELKFRSSGGAGMISRLVHRLKVFSS